ncbi:glycoside hydrolase family 3 protein [Aerococcaceae bacterium WGS1372]
MMKAPNLKTLSKKIITVDGLEFKDLNDNGRLDPYEDWRLPSEERARNLVELMNLDEKVGMLLINQLNMGKAKTEVDNTQILDEEFLKADGSPMRSVDKYPTTETIERLKMRHFILRDNMPHELIIEWINKLNEVAEATRLGIPVIVASNSRNEFNSVLAAKDIDELGFSLYPGTLGIAAAVQGDLDNGNEYKVIDDFVKFSRNEWLQSGLRKGYMYMADVVTDPRWQRTDGTFGEDPELISQLIKRLIIGFQGEELSDDSISLTIKHFPGGGARENGFDPHYKEGKWNIYRTEGSLENYHLPTFVEAAKHNPSSIMPYYSAPSIEKSHFQEFDGELIPFEEVGMAFSHYILDTLLRGKLGFKGYINSDTGIIGKMAWGVESLSKAGRFAKAINAGTDLISGTNEVAELKKAVEKGYISMKRLDQANERLLMEMFDLGLFDEKTYIEANQEQNEEVKQQAKEAAYNAHLKSVTLLKNQSVLPIPNQKVLLKPLEEMKNKLICTKS